VLHKAAQMLVVDELKKEQSLRPRIADEEEAAEAAE
jgi:hypothetical protein